MLTLHFQRCPFGGSCCLGVLSKTIMPDQHDLRQTYGRMADAELLQLAVEEAADLTPEAAEVLGEELCKRGFSNSVGVAVAAQRHQWTPQEMDLMVSRLQQLPCPTCSATGQRLNGAKICSQT